MVEFKIAKTSKLMDISKFTIGRPVRIKTDDDIYDSYISAITLSDENFVYFKSGNLRNTLIDKLKSNEKSIGNKLDVTGGSILGDLSINGDTHVGGNAILETAIINENLEVEGTLDAGGKTTLKDTTVNGNEKVTGHVAVGKEYDTSKGGVLQVGGDNYIDGANVVAGRSYLGGKVRNSQGTYVENFAAGHGTSGYIKICTLTIGGTYQNQPIIFGVIQRTRYGRIILQFNSSADTKPSGFSIFQSSGNINPYIVKTGDSTWDLYIQKSEAYDQIEITELYKGEYQNAITITWKNEIATSLPSGYVSATREYYSINVNHSDSSNTATTASDLSDTYSYVRSGTREEGFESEWLKTHSFAGTINNNGWRNLINVRHRGGGGDGHYWGMQIMDDNLTSASWNLLVRKQNSGTWYGWEILPRKTVLYNNSGGTTGTVTLSQSADNFNIIDIFFHNNDNRRGSARVYKPNLGSNPVWLSAGYIYQGISQVYMKYSEVKISGTSITVVVGTENWGTFEMSGGNCIYIDHVDGYK